MSGRSDASEQFRLRNGGGAPCVPEWCPIGSGNCSAQFGDFNDERLDHSENSRLDQTAVSDRETLGGLTQFVFDDANASR